MLESRRAGLRKLADSRAIISKHCLVCGCLLLMLVDRAEAIPQEARRQVLTGVRQHAAGEYELAAESFAKAAEVAPDDPRVTFDQACALASRGKREEARTLFQQAATAADQALVAASHYNLGCLTAEQAQDSFGDKPEEADEATRSLGLQLLQQAVGHYRDCLQADAGHASARRNLELLRLWMKHMQDVWSQRDRERRREEMDLLAFLQWLETEQRGLETATRELESLSPSPRQRQALSQAEREQRVLADEVPALHSKLEQAVGAAPAADTSGSRKLLEALTQQTLAARRGMSSAADDLAGQSPAAAKQHQAEAIASLNEVYRVVAPYEHVLQRATRTQQNLVASTESMLAEESSAPPDIDSRLAARDQGLVAAWSETLPAKARQGLRQLEGQAPAAPSPADDAAVQQQQQAEQAQRESFQKAIELAPQVVELAKGAAALVDDQAWEAALPKQQEALRLLKEIAPKAPPQESPDEDQQQPPNEQSENQQDKQSPDSQQDSSNEEQRQPPEQQPQQQNKQRSSPPQQPDLSRQRVEALLRQVRQREREHRERERQLLELLQQAAPVEKDW